MKHFAAVLLVLLIIISTAACSPAATTGASASPAPAATAPAKTEPAAASPSPAATPEATVQPTDAAAKDYAKIGDDLMTNDSLGALKYGMTESELTAALGEPDSKAEPSVWGSDGKNHSEWSYKAKGLTINMAEGDGSKAGYVVFSINAIAPCDLATQKGVKIGDTLDSVFKAYGDAVENKDASQTTIVAGTVYGGIIFGIENGKVSLVFIGAAAE